LVVLEHPRRRVDRIGGPCAGRLFRPARQQLRLASHVPQLCAELFIKGHPHVSVIREQRAKSLAGQARFVPVVGRQATRLALLVGAWAMSETGSMVPMALAASACLMLTAPLVRHFLTPAAERR